MSGALGVMAVMGVEGDVRLEWNPDDPADVEKARVEFDRLRAKGYMAFGKKEGGGRGQLMQAFDPGVRSIIMVPKVVGG